MGDRAELEGLGDAPDTATDTVRKYLHVFVTFKLSSEVGLHILTAADTTISTPHTTHTNID